VTRLGADANDVAVFAARLLTPLPVAPLQEFIDSCERVLIVELSYAAQFHQYLRTQVDLPRQKTTVYSRSGGKNFGATEIAGEIRKNLIAAEMIEEVLA
jgi:pyruvate/2-oxoacid:ferredoxin oxidoreductase alpha subunit